MRDYIRRKVNLERAKRAARTSHVSGCDCFYCWTAQDVQARIAAGQRRQRERYGEPPY